MPTKQTSSEGRGKLHFVELLTVDIDGVPKGMTVPISPVDSITPLRKGTSPIPQCGIDGSSVKGLATITTSDLQLVPDSTTIQELPNSLPRRAVVISDVFKRAVDGSLSPHPLAPRTILKRNVERLAAKGMEMRVKLEPEFYFLTEDGVPLDAAGYADIFPENKGMDLLLETALDLRAAGIETAWLHSEHGQSQQELELNFTELSRAADNFLLFKLLVRRRAALYDVEVSFMPKPFPSQAGSGLHCHLQLWQGNQNLFGNPDGTLTDKGRHFVAGLMHHAPAITAVANPTVNSFKRLVPGFEAPVYNAWGYLNRSALIRIPLFTSAENAAIEFRSPDPLTNPYLLFAVLLGAGMDGVEKQFKAPEPVTEDLYHMSPQQLAQRKIEQLPDTLQGALQALQKDKILTDVLGQEFTKLYQEIREAEWYQYTHAAVTDQEWEWYLHR
ncbi:MAG: glutamine synthetase family protein [Candidatus Hermodarchaeota archaeon]